MSGIGISLLFSHTPLQATYEILQQELEIFRNSGLTLIGGAPEQTILNRHRSPIKVV